MSKSLILDSIGLDRFFAPWDGVLEICEYTLILLVLTIPFLLTFRNSRRSIEDARKVKLEYDPDLVVVGVVLINGVDFSVDHVMVQLKKPRTPEMPILYGPPGGGYEKDDMSVFDGACREFLEETGLDILSFPKDVFSYEGYTVTDVGRNNQRIVYNFYLRVMVPNTVFQWNNSGIDMEAELMLDLPYNCCKGHNWEVLADIQRSKEYSYSRMKNLLLTSRVF